MLKWHLVLEREVSRLHQRQSDLLSLGVGQLVQRCSSTTKEKHRLAVSAKQVKTGRIPEQMVSAAVRNIALKPSWPASRESSGVTAFPARLHVAALPPAEPDIARAQPHVGAKSVSKISNANKEARLSEESLLYFKGRKLGGRADSVQRPTPSYQSVANSLYRVREQATCRNSSQL